MPKKPSLPIEKAPRTRQARAQATSGKTSAPTKGAPPTQTPTVSDAAPPVSTGQPVFGQPQPSPDPTSFPSQSLTRTRPK